MVVVFAIHWHGQPWVYMCHLIYKILRQENGGVLKKRTREIGSCQWLVRSHLDTHHLIFCQRWRWNSSGSKLLWPTVYSFPVSILSLHQRPWAGFRGKTQEYSAFLLGYSQQSTFPGLEALNHLSLTWEKSQRIIKTHWNVEPNLSLLLSGVCEPKKRCWNRRNSEPGNIATNALPHSQRGKELWIFSENRICWPLTTKKIRERSCPKKIKLTFSFSSLFSCWLMSNSLQPHGLEHTRLPRPSPSLRVCSNSCALSHWCHPTISSSDIPSSSYVQFFPRLGVVPLNLEGWGEKKRWEKNETDNSYWLWCQLLGWMWNGFIHHMRQGLEFSTSVAQITVWSPRAYRATSCLWAEVE